MCPCIALLLGCPLPTTVVCYCVTDRHVTPSHCRYSRPGFLSSYVSFMTTPDSHNDTCATLRQAHLPEASSTPQQCCGSGTTVSMPTPYIPCAAAAAAAFVTTATVLTVLLLSLCHHRYAESFHRDFFKNWAAGVPPERCAEVHCVVVVCGLCSCIDDNND